METVNMIVNMLVIAADLFVIATIVKGWNK